MKPVICSRCKKNIAVVFITKIENGETVNEGLCLKCAKDLGIKPVDDMMQKMGISDEDLEGITSDMMEALRGIENAQELMPADDEDDSEDDGKTATFPFLNKLFGSNPEMNKKPEEENETPGKKGDSRPAKRKFLNTYCISLTDKAKEGKLDHIVGRQSEIERVVQILNRRQKNNPCLIGEPGVGKTAIAEGLAQRITEGKVPYKLLDKEVHLLDLTALVAGTQFRGQFESRMKGLIQEITRLGNIILVIDEVHTIVGAGDAEGSMNAANILKPALSRGEIQVIGATTLNEYRKHIEKDSALERRFQPVMVNEPTIDESIEILRGIAHYYEDYHGVTIPDNIVKQCVVLSERYITDRFLPDKAIDLLDEACSDLNLTDETITQTAMAKKVIDDIRKERELLMSNDPGSSYERLAHLRSEELQKEQELIRLEEQGRPSITMDHLAKVIEMWTKVPASTIAVQEYERLAGLSKRLKARVVGQDEAVDAVSAAIKRKRVGISPKRRPVSFIFVGPTGVGKTELVKCVADDMFNSVESLIRLDMSEYMEKYSVSKIIGSPPGYVGYDEAGQLTEKIRRRPYSVVLFDEIEKAHPDVLNILLQILDDGTVTDAQGRKINFENTIIIMTSNAGSEESGGSLGFDRSESQRSRDKTMNALQSFLRPEFINRVDEIITFNHLSRENFKQIAAIMLGELKTALAERAIAFKWEDSALDYLTEKSFSVKYGARNLRRAIQKDIEDPLAEQLIERYEDPVTHVRVDAVEGKLVIKAF